MAMTSVSGILSSAIVAAGHAPREQMCAAAREPKAASSRALIPLQPAAPSDMPMHTRPQASYLAHLIATQLKLPQTRERRRAEPQDAVDAYAAAGAGPAPAGQSVHRTV
jgi:hypothetical protein